MDQSCEVGVFLKSNMKSYSFHSKEQNIKFSEKLNDTKNYADLLCTALYCLHNKTYFNEV